MIGGAHAPPSFCYKRLRAFLYQHRICIGSDLCLPGLLNKTRLLLAVGASFILACATMQVWPWEFFQIAGLNQWLWLGISGVVGLAKGDLHIDPSKKHFATQSEHELCILERFWDRSLALRFLFSLVPFVVMAITTIVHREPLHWRSVLGATIAVAGVLIP